MLDKPSDDNAKAQPEGTNPPAMDIDEETGRIKSRREWTDLAFPEPLTKGQIGLALSGGGIRSATFSLGVMQALSLADAPIPQQSAPSASQSSTAAPQASD